MNIATNTNDSNANQMSATKETSVKQDWKKVGQIAFGITRIALHLITGGEHADLLSAIIDWIQ